MKLGLSSDAARGASAQYLADICARRGLAALEITLDDVIAAEGAADVFGTRSDAGVQLSGLLATLPVRSADALLSRQTGAPLIIGGTDERAERIAVARDLLGGGVPARVLIAGPASQWLDEVAATRVPFAWQIDEACADPEADARRILERIGRIDYVRLVGGGPETALQEGRGVGAVMRVLALAGYTGPLILTPSSQRYRIAWSAWLGRRGGWGCGSAAERRDNAVPLLRTS